jgi:hypothetical protein
MLSVKVVIEVDLNTLETLMSDVANEPHVLEFV